MRKEHWVTDPTALEMIVRLRGLKPGDGAKWRHRETREVQQFDTITPETAAAAQDYFEGFYIDQSNRAWELIAWKPAG